MSKPREANPELARVLSRVNALMQHDLEASSPDAAAQEAIQSERIVESDYQAKVEVELPVLTDVYEGEPPIPVTRELDDFGVSVSPSEVPPDDQALQAIVAELMPLIRKEVKRAVRKELINMEKIVNHRLETEFIQTLMRRLESGQD